MDKSISLNDAAGERASNWTIKKVPLRTRLRAGAAAAKAGQPMWVWLDAAVELAATRQEQNILEGPTEGQPGPTEADGETSPEQIRIGIGFVYVLGRDTDALIKIGKADRTKVRVTELQKKHGPITVHYLAKVEQPFEVERRTHELLRDFHRGAEWFDVSIDTAKRAIREANKAAQASRNTWHDGPPGIEDDLTEDRANSYTSTGQPNKQDVEIVDRVARLVRAACELAAAGERLPDYLRAGFNRRIQEQQRMLSISASGLGRPRRLPPPDPPS